ncbi:hypothetical protein D3C75_927440 [compost metagenome]
MLKVREPFNFTVSKVMVPVVALTALAWKTVAEPQSATPKRPGLVTPLRSTDQRAASKVYTGFSMVPPMAVIGTPSGIR